MRPVYIISFILLLFFICWAFFIAKSRKRKMELDFKEAQSKLLEESYVTTKKLYDNNKYLYQDMNRHLDHMSDLIERGCLKEAKEYINEISKPISKLSRTAWTGDNIIDALINSKKNQMSEQKIAFDCNVEFPKNTNISGEDMCVILGNLLDNAIEASEHVNDTRRIRLTMRRMNQFLIIQIMNRCIEKEISGLFPKTSKADVSLHGWGLINVNNAVKKYNGTMECHCENNIFTVSIMLCFGREGIAT